MLDAAALSAAPSLEALADLHEAYFRRLRAASLPSWLRLNLSVPQLRLLHLLVYDGPQLSGSLAQALGVTPSTVTGLCDRLIERGLARREEDTADRRCTRVYATDKGHALVTEHFSSTREQLLRIFEKLTPAQRGVVEQALQALVSAGTADAG
ncbi:MAG TPA: MarR family transcriptional regulator [Chloroflexota bacterium]|nr:MarR family transcriptional regulator [Chloroflexota bacterium]